jgi:hypothetical protein
MDSTNMNWLKDSINDFDESSDNDDSAWPPRDNNKWVVGAAPPAAVTTPFETIKPFVESTFKQMRSTAIQSAWGGVSNEMMQQLVEQEWLAVKDALMNKCSSIIELQSTEDNAALKDDLLANGYRLAIVEDNGTEQWVLEAPTSGAIRAVQDGEYEVARQKDVAAEGSHTTTAVDDASPPSVQEKWKRRKLAHEQHSRTTTGDDDADVRADVAVGMAAEVHDARAVRLEAALKRMRDSVAMDGAESKPVEHTKDGKSVDALDPQHLVPIASPHAPDGVASGETKDGDAPEEDKVPPSGALIVKFADGPRFTKLLSQLLRQSEVTSRSTLSEQVKTMWDEAKFLAPISHEFGSKFAWFARPSALAADDDKEDEFKQNEPTTGASMSDASHVNSTIDEAKQHYHDGHDDSSVQLLCAPKSVKRMRKPTLC